MYILVKFLVFISVICAIVVIHMFRIKNMHSSIAAGQTAMLFYSAIGLIMILGVWKLIELIISI